MRMHRPRNVLLPAVIVGVALTSGSSPLAQTPAASARAASDEDQCLVREEVLGRLGPVREWLAREPGIYEDPYSRVGRLGSEIWRAIRLVVDTGLHAKGCSQQRAVAYFLENSATTRAQAESEVRRYLVLPGQATSYKIGMLKIQELRRKAEAALGDRFDIRAFHDTILGGGALPLTITILETRVEWWVASVRR